MGVLRNSDAEQGAAARTTECPLDCGATVVLNGMVIDNPDGSPHDCDES